MKNLLFLIAICLLGAGMAQSKTIYDFKVETVQGKTVPLKNFSGKVLLIVNTASRCGFTSQYKELQSLYDIYQKRGLEVLAFPSNDFGAQEPGSNQEIATFCQKNFGVTFPVFSKGPVSGSSKQPLFKYLTEEGQGELKGEVSWNFEKFLVDKKGNLISRFRSSVEPKSPAIIQALETALK